PYHECIRRSIPMASAGSVSHSRILAGLLLGAAAGCIVNAVTAAEAGPHPAVAAVVNYVTKPVGAIFLNLLFLAIVPLVFASIALGIARLGGSGSVGSVGARTLAYFLITTACAAAIGLSLVNAIQPGK